MSTLISYTVPRTDMSDFIDDLFNDMSTFESHKSWPQVDITENDQIYLLKAELPGIDKKDISIKIEKGVMTIEGEKKVEQKHEKGKFYHYERSCGKFSRSFTLPEDADSGKIEAKMENGVLNLNIPKAEKAKPRTIEVKV